MNRSVYEGKFLLNLVGGTLRQDESFPVMRNMNWARLYRIAEYHEITSAVYLGGKGSCPFWRAFFSKVSGGGALRRDL